MPPIPHLALPLRIVDGHAVTLEQDTPQEIAQCVRVVLLTPAGSREEMPAFGLPDPLFVQGGADLDEIERAIARWEPRADIDARTDDSRLAEGVSQVIIEIAGAA